MYNSLVMITIYENKESTKKDLDKDSKSRPENKIKTFKTDIGKKTQDSGLSAPIRKFIEKHQTKANELSRNLNTIKVNEFFGKLARAYEKVRTTVEYKGEHVLRRNAIERILKRLIWEQDNLKVTGKYDSVSESLIKELIWAKYLPNNSLPQYLIADVTKSIEKYSKVLNGVKKISNISKSKVYDWIWGIASSEIEDILDPTERDLYIQLMFDWFKEQYIWEDSALSSKEKDTQIYLAIHRAYQNSDEAIMRYHLLLKKIPKWNNATESEVNYLIENFTIIFESIEKELTYAKRIALFRIIHKHVPAFEILQDVAQKEENLEKVLTDKNLLTTKVSEVCEKKYSEIKRKVRTGITRSIIYIFISKVLLALALEIPYEVIRFSDIRYIPLIINITVPPFFMGMLGSTIKTPSEKNTKLILDRIFSIVYKESNPVKTNLKLDKKINSKTINLIFGIVYFVLFFVVFGLLFRFLTNLGFSLLGILIFYVFTSLVFLFAYRVKYNASKLNIEEIDEGLLDHLLNYLTAPFLNFGFYLSKGLSVINILTVVLDFIIEAPLKTLLGIFEGWTDFVKEKKKEVIELPE